MKRFAAILLAVLLMLCLAACQDTGTAESTVPDTTDSAATVDTTVPDTTEPETTVPTVFTLPEGFTLAGIDLSGMTKEAAAAAVTEAISGYTLTVQANGKAVTVSAEDMGLTLDQEALAAYLSALEDGQAAAPDALASCDTAKVIGAVEGALTKSAKNAAVQYSAAQDKFIITQPQNGQKADANSIKSAVTAAVGALETSMKVSVYTAKTAYTVNADDPRLAPAAEAANSYLGITLAYTYETAGVTKTTVTIPNATLATFVLIDKEYNVSVNDDGIRDYISNMSRKYKGATTSGKFKTSYGTELNYKVQYYGAALDTNAMFADLKDCFVNHISDTRIAPYLDAITDKPYGGNYVEINMTEQRLWCYKDGKCVVNTPIVTGNAYTGAYTPTGVYSIYGKKRDVWLTGRTFRDFVHYWIPFNRNIGMHDAMWRDEFGDEIYRYNGSHGCVNMPPSVAGTVYENVSIGTKVIVYGGKRSSGSFTQELTGTAQYDLANDAAAFQLDVTPKYRGTVITYKSDNEAVATVSEAGIVTVTGTGTANITVSSAKVGSMSAASFTVQVNVHSACDEGRHTVTEWVWPTPACQSGMQTGSCDLCGQLQEQPHTPTEHDFTAGGSHCAHGCGTANPDHIPPETTEPETTEPETTEPETTEPETTEPETTEPETTEPETTEAPAEA